MDLAQDVFIMAYQKLEYLDDQATSAWLYRAASHRLIDFYRNGAQRRTCVSLSTLQVYPAEEPFLSLVDPGFERTETTDWLAQTMRIAHEVCTQSQFEIIRAYYVLGSFEAVSAALQVGPSTVRSHFLRGRANLLAHLVQHRPDLIGGAEAIRVAVEALTRGEGRAFTLAERKALSDPGRRPKAFRSACVKIARQIGLY